MLVECGFTSAATEDGQEFTFRPSFGRIASLGDPHEIVSLYAALHGPRAEAEAAYVLACLCDQEDPTPLIGGVKTFPKEPGRQDEIILPAMSASEMVLIARHLMKHGIVGTAKPGTQDGKYSDSFNASEYVSAARVHLGLSSADAEALSMTEFQRMLHMKFPDAKATKDAPTREEYEAALKHYEGRKRG